MKHWTKRKQLQLSLATETFVPCGCCLEPQEARLEEELRLYPGVYKGLTGSFGMDLREDHWWPDERLPLRISVVQGNDI